MNLVLDLVSAIPSLVAWGVLPGLALATAIAPGRSWGERVALTPGLSAGVIGALALVERAVHIGFAPVPTALALGPIVIVAAFRVRSHRRSGATAVAAASWRRAWPVISGVIVGLAGCAVLLIGYQHLVLPPWNDAAYHGQIAHLIQAQADPLPFIPVREAASGTYRLQMGYEATAALIAGTSGITVARVLLPLALLSVAVLPVGLALLTVEVTGSRLAGSLAPLCAYGSAMPAFILNFGDYPLVLASTLMLPALVTIRGYIVDGDRAALGLAVAAAVSIWVIHGSEAFSVAILGVPLVLLLLIDADRAQRWRRALVLGALAGAAVGAFVLLARTPALPVWPGSGPPFTSQSSDSADVIGSFFKIIIPDPARAFLYLAGVIVTAADRRLRWLLAAHLLLLLSLFDRNVTHVLDPVWRLTRPWSDSDRLILLQYFVVAPLMAMGAASAVRRAWGDAGGVARRSATSFAATAMVAFIVVTGMHDDLARYSVIAGDHGTVTAADLTAISRLQAVVPRNGIVLNAAINDAGQWIPALTSLDIQISEKWIEWAGDDDWRLVALARACSDPDAADRALAGVDAVYLGARTDAGAVHVWDPSCLTRLPHLQTPIEVQSADGTAVIFRVDPP
jgi:hypothetical protein